MQTVNTRLYLTNRMSKDGINQNYFKDRLRALHPTREGNNMLFLTKMVLIAVLLSGLVSLSSYTFTANATTTTTTNHVITGDTQKYRIFEGQAPTMQPSDAGMQTNPMPGTFEWWYLQGQFTDGSKMQITYEVKPWMDNNGPLQPYIGLSITTPNSTHLFGQAKVDVSQFNAARNTMNVTMGDNSVRGDLNTVKMHFATTKNGVGADLSFR